ncbi:hypothetical protein OG413_29570 [Streptomyces sp. NBC_01433]|uniref:hypothetical protein n=1 Tax=Streptomyces sp. NBC_01433 TaxID=2903864 RepID=UPI00225541C3|nr:hypothetical protein [Streptomyces sp. NBC_01433]MCX4679390.1 hypothetical protein [Streptomyces sp. NBC_01433]
MHERFLAAPGSVGSRRPLARRLVVSLLLPLLTVVGSALVAPGSALAAPAAGPSLARATGPSFTFALTTVPDAPCTSGDPVVCAIREMTPEEKAQAREVRVRYHQLLDEMESVEQRMREEGRSDEEIARVLVTMRNEAKDITRAGMSPEAVAMLEARNLAKYGNPLGPTADQQYARYGSWAKVIDAATRSSAAVDQELGLEPRH